MQNYFQYWGKADEKYIGRTTWHPLGLDMAACGYLLLASQPSWLAALERLSGLCSEALHRWVTFLLVVHDAGKFGDDFQSLRPDLWKCSPARVGMKSTKGSGVYSAARRWCHGR